jgi:hypothetical protein
VHVGLVHVIGLNLVEDFAVDGEGFVGFVVGGAAENVADAGVTEDGHRDCDDGEASFSIHILTCTARMEKYNTAQL